MNVKITDLLGDILLSVTRFPSGERTISLDRQAVGNVTILWDYRDDSELVLLAQIVETLPDSASVVLIAPYMPHTRMDKRMCALSSLSAKVFFSLLDSIGFTKIVTYDVHSDYLLTRHPHLTNVHQSLLFKHFLIDNPEFTPTKDTVLVSPDTGAKDKTSALGKDLNLPVLQGYKIRDPKTGSLSSFEITTVPLSNVSNFLIVDDICDGGGTFLGLAKTIKDVYPDVPISLYTTHGIYSKGRETLEDVFTRVGCYNDMNK